VKRVSDGRCPYPTVEPVGADQPRPFWSVMIPTVGREYLEETLKSVLAQDRGPREMQIEVVDNGGPAFDAGAMVRRFGAERIGYFRQPQPVGMAENWTTCVRRARGQWVHVLHDDDVLLPGFFDAHRHAVEQWPAAVMTFCRVVSIDGRRDPQVVGTPYVAPMLVTDLPRQLTKGNPVCASSVVARRSVYEAVGGFDGSLAYTFDWDMWSRVAAIGPVANLGGPYLLYRDHPRAFSRSREIRARKVKDVLRAAELAIARLPAPPAARSIRRLARRVAADVALRDCWLLQLHGQSVPSLPLALSSLSLHPSRYGALLLARGVAAVARHYVRQSVGWCHRRGAKRG
jgi:GT2 family glycosyltransferase